MKNSVLLLLIAPVLGGDKTKEGCITEAGDESNIGGCFCHSSCTMCGYGTGGAGVYVIPVD